MLPLALQACHDVQRHVPHAANCLLCKPCDAAAYKLHCHHDLMRNVHPIFCLACLHVCLTSNASNRLHVCICCCDLTGLARSFCDWLAHIKMTNSRSVASTSMCFLALQCNFRHKSPILFFAADFSTTHCLGRLQKKQKRQSSSTTQA